MIALLALSARAEDPQVRSETLFQARTDLTGELFYGGIEALRGTAVAGPARLEGYGDLGFRQGFDQPVDGEIYLLTADGEAGNVRWTLGRQPLLLPTWNRRLDGGWLTVQADRSLRVDLAAGVASRSGSNGAIGGVPVGRLALAWERGPGRATAGVWTELTEVSVVHADLEARVAPNARELAPQLGVVAAVGATRDEGALERARVDLGVRALPGVRTTTWVEHRETLGSPALRSDILATFAPTGSDAAGLGVGIDDRKRDRLWVSGSVQRWWKGVEPATVDDPGLGLVGELRYDPRCGAQRWCLSPSWQGVSGNGGWYQRMGARLQLPVPSPVDLGVRGAWVPWQKPHLEQRSAAVAGATAVVDAGRWLDLEAGCDLWFESLTPDTRAWVAVQLDAGGAR